MHIEDEIQNRLTIIENNLKKNNAIEKLAQEFAHRGFFPVLGAEIEFYLSGKVNFEEFQKKLAIPIKKEKGQNQFEIDVNILDINLKINTTNIKTYINNFIEKVNFYINKIKLSALNSGGEAYLSPKPFESDYGNAMHIHINIINKEGNLFDNKKALDNAAYYILSNMMNSFMVFCSSYESLLRFNYKFHAPSSVSYGRNNRTTSIRVPDKIPYRIEHRLSSPETSIYLALFVILKSILIGLKCKTYKECRIIYGNAYDEQYNLDLFPKSLIEINKKFNSQFFKV